MKKSIFLFLTFTCFTLSASAQIDMDEEFMQGSTLVAMPGQILVYEVDFNGNVYDFIVHIKEVEDGISFDYEMTNEAGTKGSVNMSKEAVDNAIAQNNYFGGGEMNLDDQTTVWVSKKVFSDLVNEGVATISPDGGMSRVEIGDVWAGHNYEMYNAISDMTFDDISYVYAESPDGDVRYWIHLNESNSLILKMDLGWSITLKELRKE
ncbi:MAG: hypothetical protein K9G67_01415 [Bacteroidales bacterium]|nr:hypothetical protein [Bacteroidales bacterium]MCF8345176.1 hypothetical protein [Bacteroidales bacterium]MCF8350067.1 hypothetical protein [Bacteroidales bacterium]MCF8374989.1 hypothetical protein [Bacteroidales bacterium]